MDFLAEKERKEERGSKDLRVLLGQQEIKGVLEGLAFWGERESLEFLETQGQWVQLDSEESRVIMASQAMVVWEKKE